MRYAETEDGIRYSIEHERLVEACTDPVTGLPSSRFSPKGGGTTVKIVGDDDDVLAVGVARTSLKDNFNAKLGHRIALGRALSELTGEADRRRTRRLDLEARVH